jgi:hypothetical protein
MSDDIPKANGRPGFQAINNAIGIIVGPGYGKAERDGVVAALSSDQSEESIVAMAKVDVAADKGFFDSLDEMQDDPDGRIVLKALRRWLARRIAERLGCHLEPYWHAGTYEIEFRDGLAILRFPAGLFCEIDGTTDLVFIDNRSPVAAPEPRRSPRG